MSTRLLRILVLALATCLIAPIAGAQDAPTPVSGDAPAEANELTPFQARHGDLVEESRKAALERGGSLLRETPEPTIKFDKNRFRAMHGNSTVDRGRAWQSEARPDGQKSTPGFGLTLDYGIESLDLNTASGISGFLGTPPDTMGAVGPTQFFNTSNSGYRVHDKITGAPDVSLDVAPSEFWVAAVDPNNNGGGDPRVRFDRINNRWVVIAFELAPANSLANNRVLIAVSDGPTISAGTVWTQYFITPRDTVGGALQNGCFCDYPMLGIDRNAIYVGANMFNISSPTGACGGSSQTTDTAVFVTAWSNLPMGGGDASAVTTAFDGLLDDAPIWTPMPVDNANPTAGVGYIIGHDAGSDTNLKLGRISNPGGAAGTPTLAWTDVSVSNKNDGYTNGVPYPGVPAPTGNIPNWGLDPLGFRAIGGAQIQNGRLWTAMTSSVDGPTGTLQLFPATGDRHSVVYFEINLGTDTLVQDGNVFDTATAQDDDPTHVWMGSIGVNGQGHAVVGATGTNTSDIAPSAVWAGRLSSDPLGEFSNPQIYVAGTNTGNARHNFESQNRATRWGDYAQVTIDPCDDMTFYALAEYQDTPAVSTGGNWSTALARILAPAPTFTTASTTSIPLGQSSTTVDVTGTGFYSPPTTGMPPCRTDIGASSDISGLVVNGVTYNSPTSITIDFDTTGATGSGTVTITNPDGQTTSFGAMVSAEIFTDGFELGNTTAWSSSVP